MKKRTLVAVLVVVTAFLVAGLVAVSATARPAPPDGPAITTTAEPERTPAGATGTECCPEVPAPRPAQGHRVGTD